MKKNKQQEIQKLNEVYKKIQGIILNSQANPNLSIEKGKRNKWCWR